MCSFNDVTRFINHLFLTITHSVFVQTMPDRGSSFHHAWCLDTHETLNQFFRVSGKWSLSAIVNIPQTSLYAILPLVVVFKLSRIPSPLRIFCWPKVLHPTTSHNLPMHLVALGLIGSEFVREIALSHAVLYQNLHQVQLVPFGGSSNVGCISWSIFWTVFQ